MKSNMFKTWEVNHKTKTITAKSMCQVKERVWGLRRSNLLLKKSLNWLKKIKTCNKLLNWRLKIEEITCQKFDEDFIENIVENLIEVKHGNESIIHNPQVSVDLLRMTTQYVDFLGVENFNFIINPLLIDVANKLKVDKKKFYATPYEEFKFQNRIMLLKHSKYLFIWSRRF